MEEVRAVGGHEGAVLAGRLALLPFELGLDRRHVVGYVEVTVEVTVAGGIVADVERGRQSVSAGCDVPSLFIFKKVPTERRGRRRKKGGKGEEGERRGV